METVIHKAPTQTTVENAHFGIVVDSIGTAGIGLVQALKKVSPLSENKIAALLFQTPSLLFSDIPEQAAQEMNGILLSTGLESKIIRCDAPFEPGDSNHEVALIINDFENIHEVVKEVFVLTGLGVDDIRKMLCKSPTVLLGKISRNTAQAISRRFGALGVEVDISNPYTAQFDVFKGVCSVFEQNLINQIIASLRLAGQDNSHQHNLASLLCAGLSRQQADQLWAQTNRTNLPIKIVNRDFERFDLRLDEAPQTPEMTAYLTQSTGMPEKIAHKVLQKLPIVLHKNIRFKQVEEEIERLKRLGASASAHLLVFQSFSLQIQSMKDSENTLDIIHIIGGVDKAAIGNALLGNRIVEGPFTSPQVRWMQHELKKIGTITNRVLR